MPKLYLLRHGRQTYEGKDPELSPTGRKQAGDVIHYLQKAEPNGITCIVRSDLQRAQETAEIISGGLGGIRIITDPRLREIKVGWKSAEQYDTDLRRALTQRDWRTGGGETAIGVGDRVGAAIAEHREKGEGIVIVSSEYAIIQFLLNNVPEELARLRPELKDLGKQETMRGLAHCSLTTLNWDGSHYTAEGIGTTDHLNEITFIERDIPLVRKESEQETSEDRLRGERK